MMTLLEALAIQNYGWSSRVIGQPEAYKEARLVIAESANRAFREHRIAALRAELSRLEADSDGGECD